MVISWTHRCTRRFTACLDCFIVSLCSNSPKHFVENGRERLHWDKMAWSHWFTARCLLPSLLTESEKPGLVDMEIESINSFMVNVELEARGCHVACAVGLWRCFLYLFCSVWDDVYPEFTPSKQFVLRLWARGRPAHHFLFPLQSDTHSKAAKTNFSLH